MLDLADLSKDRPSDRAGTELARLITRANDGTGGEDSMERVLGRARRLRRADRPDRPRASCACESCTRGGPVGGTRKGPRGRPAPRAAPVGVERVAERRHARAVEDPDAVALHHEGIVAPRLLSAAQRRSSPEKLVLTNVATRAALALRAAVALQATTLALEVIGALEARRLADRTLASDALKSFFT